MTINWSKLLSWIPSLRSVEPEDSDEAPAAVQAPVVEHIHTEVTVDSVEPAARPEPVPMAPPAPPVVRTEPQGPHIDGRQLLAQIDRLRTDPERIPALIEVAKEDAEKEGSIDAGRIFDLVIDFVRELWQGWAVNGLVALYAANDAIQQYLNQGWLTTTLADYNSRMIALNTGLHDRLYLAAKNERAAKRQQQREREAKRQQQREEREERERKHSATVAQYKAMIQETTQKLRQLKINLTGDPDAVIRRPNPKAARLVGFAISAVAAYLEFGAGFEVVSFQIDPRVARAISIASIVSVMVLARFGGEGIPKLQQPADAKDRASELFPDGTDPVTGERVVIHKPSRRTRWVTVVNTLGLALFSAFLLVSRYFMAWKEIDGQRTFDWTGTFATILLVVVGWIYWAIYAKMSAPFEKADLDKLDTLEPELARRRLALFKFDPTEIVLSEAEEAKLNEGVEQEDLVPSEQDLQPAPAFSTPLEAATLNYVATAQAEYTSEANAAVRQLQNALAQAKAAKTTFLGVYGDYQDLVQAVIARALGLLQYVAQELLLPFTPADAEGAARRLRTILRPPEIERDGKVVKIAAVARVEGLLDVEPEVTEHPLNDFATLELQIGRELDDEAQSVQRAVEEAAAAVRRELEDDQARLTQEREQIEAERIDLAEQRRRDEIRRRMAQKRPTSGEPQGGE